MQLITKAIEKGFIKQGDTSQKRAQDIKIICKFFGGGACSWYLYEKLEEDIYMAYVNLGDNMMAECGTVSLTELKSIKFPPFNLPIERDMYFGDYSLADVIYKTQNGEHI